MSANVTYGLFAAGSVELLMSAQSWQNYITYIGFSKWLRSVIIEPLNSAIYCYVICYAQGSQTQPMAVNDNDFI